MKPEVMRILRLGKKINWFNLQTIYLLANNISIIHYLIKNNFIKFNQEKGFKIYFHIYLDPYRSYKVDRQLNQKGSKDYYDILLKYFTIASKKENHFDV